MKFPGKYLKDLLLPHDNDSAQQSEEPETIGEYLDFSSNGMTEKKKIEDPVYFDEYMGYDPSDDQ